MSRDVRGGFLSVRKGSCLCPAPWANPGAPCDATPAAVRVRREYPQVAQAVIALYSSYKAQREASAELASRLEGDSAGVNQSRLPSEEVGNIVQKEMNYFPELEGAAEELWRKARLERRSALPRPHSLARQRAWGPRAPGARRRRARNSSSIRRREEGPHVERAPPYALANVRWPTESLYSPSGKPSTESSATVV